MAMMLGGCYDAVRASLSSCRQRRRGVGDRQLNLTAIATCEVEAARVVAAPEPVSK
jgi:hypothetical protein